MKRFAALAAMGVGLAFASVAMAAGTLSGTYKEKLHTNADHGALNGTWTIAFKTGGYTAKHNGKFAVSGKDSIAGTQITFSDKSGPDKCSGTGTYSFRLTGKKLKFTKVSEPSACAGRAIVLSGTFKKA